jgi:hypothetical protein
MDCQKDKAVKNIFPFKFHWRGTTKSRQILQEQEIDKV